MIFLVQAIKKLFVTCHAAYDIRGFGRQPQSNFIYTHKVSCTIAIHDLEAEKRKEMRNRWSWRMAEKGKWGTKGTEGVKLLIYLDRLTSGQTVPQTAHCHQKVMQYLEFSHWKSFSCCWASGWNRNVYFPFILHPERAQEERDFNSLPPTSFSSFWAANWTIVVPVGRKFVTALLQIWLLFELCEEVTPCFADYGSRWATLRAVKCTKNLCFSGNTWFWTRGLILDYERQAT